jgi:hypothetical protein
VTTHPARTRSPRVPTWQRAAECTLIPSDAKPILLTTYGEWGARVFCLIDASLIRRAETRDDGGPAGSILSLRRWHPDYRVDLRPEPWVKGPPIFEVDMVGQLDALFVRESVGEILMMMISRVED